MSIPKNMLLADPDYDPNAVLDAVIERMGLKNDAALARVLEVAPPVVSKLRNRKIPIGASILVNLHEESGISIRELKRLANIPAMERYA